MIREKVAKLINVKSLVTIILTLVFSILTIRGGIKGGEFLTVFSTVIAFYFGVQHEKKVSESSDVK